MVHNSPRHGHGEALCIIIVNGHFTTHHCFFVRLSLLHWCLTLRLYRRTGRLLAASCSGFLACVATHLNCASVWRAKDRMEWGLFYCPPAHAKTPERYCRNSSTKGKIFRYYPWNLLKRLNWRDSLKRRKGEEADLVFFQQREWQTVPLSFRRTILLVNRVHNTQNYKSPFSVSANVFSFARRLKCIIFVLSEKWFCWRIHKYTLQNDLNSRGWICHTGQIV